MDISVIGGTGEEGFGLTLRLARAGEHVIIGSRSAEKGATTAEKAVEILGGDAKVSGTTNEDAAARGDVIFVTVPFGGQADIYRAIKDHAAAGKIVVDCTSPLATAVGGRARPSRWSSRSMGVRGHGITGDWTRNTSGSPTVGTPF